MMKFTNIFFILFYTALFLVHCKEKKANIEYEKFKVKKNIIPDSVAQNLFQNKINNSVISMQSMDIGFQNYPLLNQDYVCEANIDDKDTLNIWINNYNGYYGNGLLINVFNDNFKIKSVNPQVIKGIKFENYDLVKQELILNQKTFKKGDSIFGKLHFVGVVDSLKYKKMEGYFKAKIQ